MFSLMELYVKKLEQELKNVNRKKQVKLWNKIKDNHKILNYATEITNNKFNSEVICEYILMDKTLFKEKIYLDLVNRILSDKNLSRTKLNSNTFLFLTIKNKDLKLNRAQKLFLIIEANDLPCTVKYYEEKRNDISFMHSATLLDLRYLILTNKNFSFQEKKNLLNSFYPDDELKIEVLEELEWELMCELNIKNFDDNDVKKIYEYKIKDLEKIFNDTKKITEITNKIFLCTYIKNIISEKEFKKYKNND